MMKKFTLLLALVSLATLTFAQTTKTTNSLKGNGEVFFYETFDWGNPDDPKGWTAPEGYYMIDTTDNGYNWHWWPNDSLIAEWTLEPPFQSTSKEDGHLCLFANLYNNYLEPRINLDNSIVFPTFDCSSHSSVVIKFETNFMNYSSGIQGVEVSNDDGVHWAWFDAGFGTGHKDRPNDVASGVPAIFQANISEVAAGMSNVVIKITWRGTSMYYWLIDDLQLAEAWDNDLQMQHFTLGWNDNNIDTDESTSYQMPISQLGNGMAFHLFESSVLNFGEKDQNDMFLEVDVTKNNESVFNQTSDPTWLNPLWVDTARLDGTYEPTELGHYKFTYKWNQAEEEQTPADNLKEFFFHVTDSVYSRSDDTPEMEFSFGFENYTYGFGEEFWNIDHFMGTIFPIYGDCEVDGVSAYITGGKADGLIDFRYTLFWLPPAEEDPDGEGAIEWLTTESLVLDSSMFHTWIYLPFDKDGESEFLLAGDVVYAGVQYNNYNDGEKTRRNFNITVGSDQSVPRKDSRAIGWHDGWSTGFIGARNLLVKLYINDHSNSIDGVDLSSSLSSLGQNYPNPFNSATEIGYELASAQNVAIEITDMTGRKVKAIEEGLKPAGSHTLTLSATDLEAGVYFYTLSAGDYTETKRMIVSK